uniref:Transposase n=1 Tax=Rhabditophanes sp. KR3021 TaxID=114890 RepID=A0AC35UBR6_9BILA
MKETSRHVAVSNDEWTRRHKKNRGGNVEKNEAKNKIEPKSMRTPKKGKYSVKKNKPSVQKNANSKNRTRALRSMIAIQKKQGYQTYQWTT